MKFEHYQIAAGIAQVLQKDTFFYSGIQHFINWSVIVFIHF